MADGTPQETEFLDQLNARIAENLGNEQFGVTELADAMNMSRSNLLRKVKKATQLSVNQLISQQRLQKGMELLRTTALNVSEVSHRVGFNSTSYFIKCFREYYGYPPGEVGKRTTEPEVPVSPPPTRSNKIYWITAAAFVATLALGWVIYSQWPEAESPVERSIVVLPFKNDSSDSSNIYIINGLMEATLSNLQKVKDIRVLSRTSAEKYRNSTKTIPEMARELNANYFIEGSGQKMGDRILLNIQLIDGKTDHHLWSKQYRREASDIFTLQQEIARDITNEIQAVITPEERNRIEKIPTQDAVAYDLFLKGLDLLNRGGHPNLQQSVVYFDSAIARDKTFSMAYACAGMSFYYLDLYQQEKKYVDKLGSYADQALLHDPKSAEGYTAKAMHYLVRKEYSEALPYLEKGLEYKPNSTQIIGLLADFYATQLPNTGKYLEYALRGLKLDAGSGDSVSISYFHLRLGNALIQTGFVDQSLFHINRSLDYFPGNAFSRYVRAFVLYAKNGDLKETKRLLQVEFRKDTNRFDILQDIGKVSYYMGEYDSAYVYYKRFNAYRERQKLDVYVHENVFISSVYNKMGDTKKGKEFLESYRQYLESNQTAYRNIGWADYYCRVNNRDKALEHMRLFVNEADNIQYWLILFMDKAPDVTAIERSPEFVALLEEVKKKFWVNHEKLKEQLEEQGLL